jgi:mannose-1-phosphate guanylyltransferase / mannose-6-phosphate isomerase
MIRKSGNILATDNVKHEKVNIVIKTDDEIFCADVAEHERIKEFLYCHLQNRSCPLQNYETVHRPWGSFTVLDEGKNYKIKRIVVKPQQKLSLQMHHHRCEFWVIIKGCAEVVVGDGVHRIDAGNCVFIPQETVHRLINHDESDVEIFEIQNGSYLEEDDIIRYDDVYGRK